MIYEVQTSTPVIQVKEEIAEKAKAVGFGVLQAYEFREILKEKGYPIERNITVFELCNPAGAQEALTHTPQIAAYLPCRIAVYEEGFGTKLSTIGLEDILSAVETDEDLKTFMTMLFMNLKQVMHSWDD